MTPIFFPTYLDIRKLQLLIKKNRKKKSILIIDLFCMAQSCKKVFETFIYIKIYIIGKKIQGKKKTITKMCCYFFMSA